ncbi:MAG: hypothetical protein LV471_08540 [Nitrosomonas sp.]|nr:hypothetical protein [Nitrosomonas sp.]
MSSQQRIVERFNLISATTELKRLHNTLTRSEGLYRGTTFTLRHVTHHTETRDDYDVPDTGIKNFHLYILSA